MVLADDKGRAYGDANPALTLTVTGLANGDSETAALPVKPTLATNASHRLERQGPVPDHHLRRQTLGQLHAD